MKRYLIISAFAIAGALMRAGLGALFPAGSTLLVNAVGSLILVILYDVADAQITSAGTRSLLKDAGVGFCGAFTTMSTFSFEVTTALMIGAFVPGFVYLVLSLLVCIAAGFIGAFLAERIIIPALSGRRSSNSRGDVR